VHLVPSEERRYGMPREFVECMLPLLLTTGVRLLCSAVTGRAVWARALWWDSTPWACPRLADLLGGLFNEHLTLSDVQVDLGRSIYCNSTASHMRILGRFAPTRPAMSR
jgi:carboxyl-terminal processing protease